MPVLSQAWMHQSYWGNHSRHNRIVSALKKKKTKENSHFVLIQHFSQKPCLFAFGIYLFGSKALGMISTGNHIETIENSIKRTQSVD